MAPDDEPALAREPMLQAFRTRFERGSPFADEREAALDLTTEAGPVLEALHHAWCIVDAQGEDPLGHAHEALAMLTLLGRRAAGAGVSPTAALAVAPALREGLSAAGLTLPDHVERALTIVCMEGYCAGRDDRAARKLREALLEAQRPLLLAPRVLWWSATGSLDGEGLAEAGERFARQALEHDVRAGVFEVWTLGEPDDERARELLGAASQLRALGARCLWVTNGAWSAALRAIEPALSDEDVFEQPALAFVCALRHAGATLVRNNAFTRLFGL